MIIFPAIDLKGGQCVRLAEGDMDRATVYADDPAVQARAFAAAGATHLHVVDLDGSFAGESRNGAGVAAAVAAFPGKVQVGGGVRSRANVEAWLERGVWRVVMGTAALENPGLVREVAAAHPGRIVVAVDARDGFVATRGWAERSDVAVADLAARFADAGCRRTAVHRRRPRRHAEGRQPRGDAGTRRGQPGAGDRERRRGGDW